MIRKPKTNSRPRVLSTTELTTTTGGNYFRTNVLGSFGEQLDSQGSLPDIDPNTGASYDIDLDSRVEWVGTHP